MATFKEGDRIIRVGGNLTMMKVGDKVIAGAISENGRFVVFNGRLYRTIFFKPLITCKGKTNETDYNECKNNWI